MSKIHEIWQWKLNQEYTYTRHWHGWHATRTHRTGVLWLFCGVRPAHTLKVSSLWMMLNYLVW